LSNQPLVSIIIPNYNGENLILRCLGSVFKTDYPRYEVIVVDDGSKDRSLTLIEEFYGEQKDLRIVRGESNRGSAAARNLGTAQAKGPILVYLDNDAEVHPDWLNGLVDTLDRDPEIGIAQSEMLMEDRVHVSCAGELLIPYIGWIVIRGFGETPDRYSNVAEICASSGSMAVRRNVVEQAGLWDSKMPYALFEDLDFSLRVWLSGYKVVLAPQSKVYHDARAKGTSPQRKMRVEYSSHRNSLRMLLKNFELATLLRCLPLSFSAVVFRATVGLARGEYYPFLGLVRGFMWNFANFRDTLMERRVIQRQIRKVADRDFIGRISIRLSPFQIYRTYLSQGRGF
jgi:GT2 family glycosyltransferase